MCPAAPEPVLPIPPPLRRGRPLRVVFLTGELGDQGAADCVTDLVRRLAPSRFTTALCGLGELGAAGRALARTLPTTSGVMRHSVDLMVIPRLGHFWKQRVDVVVTIGTGAPLFYGGAAARWARIPATLSILGTDRPRPSLSMWNRLAASWSDGLVVQSEKQRERLMRHHRLVAGKLHVIPWGIDTQRFCFQPKAAFATRQRLRLPAGSALCGLTTAAWSESAVRRLLDIARRVRFQRSNVHFSLLGPLPGSLPLPGLLREYGLHDGVEVFSQYEQRPQDLAAMNVLCYLDASPQPHPWPVHQAMAVQVPVVGTGAEEMSAAIVHDETGFLIPADEINELTARIVQLIDDPHLARQFGIRARQHVVTHFSLEAMIRRYEQLICETYRRKRSGPGSAQAETLSDGVEFCGVSP